MVQVNDLELDKTGKIVLDQVYRKPTPLAFYAAVSQLDYSVPQLAKPVFVELGDFLRRVKSRQRLKIVDLGSSYGVNAALLKYGLDISEVFDHYAAAKRAGLGPVELAAHDRRFLEARHMENIEIVGVDISDEALSYALAARIIDAKVQGNFETGPITEAQAAALGDTDLIISTGCIGYVTERTVAAMLDAIAPKRPWMAHFVLRTFQFDRLEEMAADKGYRTLKGRVPIRQRRFASRAEFDGALARLREFGVDPAGFESEGWYYADLYLSWPEEDDGLELPPALARQFDGGLG